MIFFKELASKRLQHKTHLYFGLLPKYWTILLFRHYAKLNWPEDKGNTKKWGND